MRVQESTWARTSNQEQSPTRAERQYGRLLPIILSATFMALFDFFVVNVAAPSMQRDLGASTAALQLVVGGYAFTYAAALITGGRLGDRYGYRRLFVLGMAAFVLASAACGLAQTTNELIVARLCQGLVAAAMVPQVLALITTLFPPATRHRALAWFGATIGLGSIAGQVLGGVLLQADLFGLGWRAIFLVNVPVGLVALTLAARLLPPTRSAAHPRLDPVGVVAISGSLALALVPLTIGRQEGWPAWSLAMLGAALPALAATVGYEGYLARRGGQPLLHLELFRQRSFAAGLAISMAIYAYFGSFMLGLALFLQAGLRFSALDAGLTFAPVGVAFAATSLLMRPLIARYGVRVMAWGMALTTTGMLGLLLTVHLSGSAIDGLRLIPWLFLTGIGNGCVMPSLIGVVLTGVPAQKAGGAAGTLTTGQQFAAAVGVAVLGEVFFGVLGAHPTLDRYLTAIQDVLLLDSGLLVVSLALLGLLPRAAQPAPSAATPLPMSPNAQALAQPGTAMVSGVPDSGAA
ncbi:MAG TPA: MFS transporter [Chloroflexota bacterium]|jgi:EmrB/QacA subfamily drug resistance transporter|nr:MFS transporter [Chloroflexota bacterium]